MRSRYAKIPEFDSSPAAKPVVLPTDPEKVLWNTLLYAALVFTLMAALRFIF